MGVRENIYRKNNVEKFKGTTCGVSEATPLLKLNFINKMKIVAAFLKEIEDKDPCMYALCYPKTMIYSNYLQCLPKEVEEEYEKVTSAYIQGMYGLAKLVADLPSTDANRASQDED